MKLVLPLLLPSRLALLEFVDPAVRRDEFELYSNACTSKKRTTSIPCQRQLAGVMGGMRGAASRFSGVIASGCGAGHVTWTSLRVSWLSWGILLLVDHCRGWCLQEGETIKSI